jgi:hypothetical protein
MTTARFIENALAFKAAVQLGVTAESLVLEFKRDLPGAWIGASDDIKREARKETARDVAQFANTFGGSILYGVDETEQPNGQRVASALFTLDELDRRRKWIDESIRRFCVPSTLNVQSVAIHVDGSDIVAVNVNPSRAPIAIWDDQKKTIEYVRRTNLGREHMDPDSALRFTLDRSRAMKITLQRIYDDLKKPGSHVYVELVGGVNVATPVGFGPASVDVFLHSLDEHELQLSLNGIYVRVPYGLVRDAWLTATDRVGLALDQVRVVIEQTKGSYARLDAL